jgi:hypothetical protein
MSYHLPLVEDWPSFGRVMAMALLQASPPVGDFSPLVLQRSNLPLFLFNLTANIDGDDGTPLTDEIFEMSPVSMGSDYYGYYASAPPLTLLQATALSGAAVDGVRLESRAIGWLPRLLGFDLGMDLQNFLLRPGTRRIHRVLPWPTYYLHHFRHNRNGFSIYLTDGGHSENLGTFSLIRRACDRIIVSDAEYDPDDEFVGYGKLREAVEMELGGTLRVPEIDAVLEGGTRLPGGKRVFAGWVEHLPFADGERRLLITYIKLGLDRRQTQAYPEAVRSYLEVWGSGPFPQEPTMMLDYSTEQFQAYRDLGRHLVRTQLPAALTPPELRPPDGTREIDDP